MSLYNFARTVKITIFDPIRSVIYELIRLYHNAMPQFVTLYAGSLNKPGPIFSKEAQLCHAVAQLSMPDLILEIGIGRAASTVAFAEAIRKNGRGRIISIDINEELTRRARTTLKIHGLEKYWKPIVGSSSDKSVQQKIRELIDHKQVDILFIDGDHSFEGCVNDFKGFHDLLSNNGIVMFHDTGPFPIEKLSIVEQLPFPKDEEKPILTADGEGVYHRPGVPRAVDWLVENYPEYSVVNFHTLSELCCGVALLQKRIGLCSFDEDEVRNRESSATMGDA